MLRPNPKLHRGFSLVEVTLALGIVGFAFLSLFGLLPVGMQTFKQALNTSVRAQIVQRVFNDAMQTDFDTLVNQAPADRYFDDQGNEVAQADSIYQVKETIASQTTLPGPPICGANINLATVQISIAHNPGHVADPFAPGSKLSCAQTSMLVARNK